MQLRFNSLLIALLLSCALFVTSCKKEVVQLTPASQAEEELKSLIAKTPTIKRIYKVSHSAPVPNLPDNWGAFWTFSNGFITLNDPTPRSYNLAYLQEYELTRVGLSDGSSVAALLLFFRN